MLYKAKVVIAISLCLIFLTGCSAAQMTERPAAAVESSDTPVASNSQVSSAVTPSTPTSDALNTPEDVTADVKENIHLMDMNIRDYFNMTSDGIVKEFGRNYEVVPAGAEGSLDGYSIAGIGMTFVYDYGKHEDLICIDCDANCDIFGASPGMDFAQIQEKLGLAYVDEGFMETPDYITYERKYYIDECEYNFWSYSKSGADSLLTIFKILEFYPYDAQAAGISIDMGLTAVESLLGYPQRKSNHYEDAFGDDVYNYCYSFGEIRLEPAIDDTYTVSHIDVCEPNYPGPRGIQVGANYQEVIAKFPLNEAIDFTQPGDYSLYSRDDGENYGHISIDQDGAVSEIVYGYGAGGFGSFTLNFEIENDKVTSFGIGVMNI